MKGNAARLEQLESRLLLATVSFDSPTSNGGDGTWTVQSRAGSTVYVGPAYLYYNLNPFTAFPGYSQGDDLYVKVDYFDEGSGTVRVQYDSTRENFDPTDFHTRSTRIDTQQFVSSYHFLDSTQFANGTNGSDFRVAAFGAPVATVTISSEPFADSGLDWAWEPPWERPHSGASRPVDASTLAGKVLAGYQGWFNTPNDATDGGYFHWGRPGDWSVEQWPDPNDYDASELFPVPGVTTARGEQAYLFSSATSSVVDRHFQWMREHDIDGVFLQRFRESFMQKAPDGSYSGKPQWPLVNTRDAAHRSGRTWAIEYDIQNGGSPAQRDQVIQDVKDDWEFLTDPAGLDMLSDSHYQHEDGKPVVAIFGLYVGPTNGYSTAQQQDLINYFQSRGVYVIGAGRHSESTAQLANAGLHDAYIPWQGYWKGGDSYAPDEATLDGVTEHIPHVFPGFSWTHLQDSASATSRDREDGDFYWRMLSDAANETDAPWWFIGMFDEYDEATNLIPATDDPPAPDTDPQGNPLTYQVSDPRPNDWWMALTGAARQALQDKTSIHDTTPSEAALQNRSNVGAEARWEVGREDRLANVSASDGSAEVVDVPVQGVISAAIRSTDPYLYFAVDDEFLSAEANGRDVTIEVEYLDLVTGQFGLQYDGVGGAESLGPEASMTGSGQWRTHRFELSDAHFANRQNGGADFRFTTAGGALFVRRVSVVKESVLSAEVDLRGSNLENGLTQIVVTGDGQTTPTTSGGRDARRLTGDPNSLYLYVDIEDDFAHEVHAGLNAVVEVVYQDIGVGQINIQYDSTGPAYASSTPVSLGDTGAWRTARFYVDDAFFGGRQNDGADFRLTGAGVPFDQVRVLRSFGDLMEPEAVAATPTVDTPANTVTVSWTMTDDWRSGSSEKWTPQEDNRVLIELSDDGQSWEEAAMVFERSDPGSAGAFNPVSGRHEWAGSHDLATENLASGIYRVRLTPIDGRDNRGASSVTDEFVVYAPPALPGDYNADGAVNAADYSVWRDSEGSLVTPYTLGDGDGDGVVGPEDRLVWQANFGRLAPPPALAASSDAPAVPLVQSDPIALVAEGSLAKVDSEDTPGDRAPATDEALASLAPPSRKQPAPRGVFRSTAIGADNDDEGRLLLLARQVEVAPRLERLGAMGQDQPVNESADSSRETLNRVTQRRSDLRPEVDAMEPLKNA